MARKRFADKEQKEAIYKRAKGRCEACKVALKKTSGEYHHVKAYVDGGETEEDNLALLCPLCHRFAPADPKDWDNYIGIGGTYLPLVVGRAIMSQYIWYKNRGGKDWKNYKKEKVCFYKAITPFLRERRGEV